MKAKNSFIQRIPRINKKETGYSLVEILIAVGLLGIVTVLVTALIVTTSNSASRFGNVTTTQSEVSLTLANMQRDLSSSQKVLMATDNSVTVQLRKGSRDYEVTYFAYDPANPALTGKLPARVDVSALPNNYKSIVEVRYDISSNTVGQKVVVKGHNPTSFSDPDKHNVFDFYDTANSEIAVAAFGTDAVTPPRALNKIKRIEFRIAADAEGRGTPIQLESSATSSLSSSIPSVGSVTTDGIPVCPPNFKTVIVPTETSATLSWYSSPGATSYTIYRTNLSTGVQENVFSIGNPDTLSFEDNGLAWGTTYSWRIQANGPAGQSLNCVDRNATVVPNQIGFVNVNSLGSLDTTVLPGYTGSASAATDSVTRPSETNIPAKRVTTTNVMPGNNYTVARGLVNQLSWSTSFGTTKYNVYLSNDLTTPVAVINSPMSLTTKILGNDYGDNQTYVIKAVNVGGESFASAPITLASPPVASTISTVLPDTSARSDTTDANFTVSTRAPRTDGFRARLKQEITSSAVTCDSSMSTVDTLNFTESSVRDANAAWGSTSCYRFTPYNDAGSGISTDLNVEQLPGKFNMLAASNASSYRAIDITRNVTIRGQYYFPSAAFCWLSPNGQGTDGGQSCAGGYPNHSAYGAMGMYGTVDNTKANIGIQWSRSTNALSGYTATRDRVQTGGVVDQAPAKVISANAVYSAGNQGVVFQNEMPGSAYQINVTAKALNGQNRISPVQTFLTRPDLPKFISGRYEDAYGGGGPSGVQSRIVRVIDASATRGLMSTATSYTMVPNSGGARVSEVNFNAGTSDAVIYSGSQNILGQNLRWSRSNLSTNGLTTTSLEIGSYGRVSVLTCTTNCSNWTPWPERFPVYWSGWPARFVGGGSAAASVVTQNVTNVGEVTQPEYGGGTDAGFVCRVELENSTAFSEYCQYGEGVPVAPSNIKVTAQTGTQHRITWDAWPAATSYTVNITRNGGSPVAYTVATPSMNIDIAGGETVQVRISTTNPITTSEVSSPVTFTSQSLPAPTGVAVGAIDEYGAGLSWNAVPNATSYVVTYIASGTTTPQTMTTSGTSVNLSGLLPNKVYSVTVSAKKGTITSPQSSSVSFTTPDY